MAIHPIVIAGNPVLTTPTEPVDLSAGITDELRELIFDMFETLRASHGVGLSANQIGVNKRLFVINCPDVEAGHGTVISSEEIHKRSGRPGWSASGENRIACVINPELTIQNPPEGEITMIRDMEGCLSVPGAHFPVDRADWAQVTGVDENGQPITLSGYGFFAKCLQHEVGHLDGHLYTEYVPIFLRPKVKRLFRNRQWTEPGNSWTPGIDPDPFGN